ncbi:MAG: TMEM165/GDT1 family protein [Candidatus Firestonebacteria bacterium]|jgi:putative Ca2+/H+ antiporter (TMEM165/GDT1 family)|nr:TMEM165/GDT1 family protein [Candidatus Firestonebacteria bacterium]
MDWKIMIAAFLTILTAEMGDKTQLAVLGFAAQSKSTISVIIGAMAAFLILTVVAAYLGGFITKYIPIKYIHLASGALFIVLGILAIKGALNN